MARKRKYTRRIVEQMRAMRAAGVSRQEVAEKAGCDPSTVSRLVRWGVSHSRAPLDHQRFAPECIIIDVSRGTVKLYTKNGGDFVFRPLNNHTRKFISFVLNKALRQERASETDDSRRDDG